MVACLGRGVGKEFDCSLILASKSSPLAVYPGLELATVGEVKSLEKRPFVALDRRCPLTSANRFLELPGVDLDQFRIEPELSSRRKNEIAAEGVSDCVHRLVERMLRERSRALGPEVSLDTVARKSLPASEGENREQAQRPFLLRGYGDCRRRVPQGK